MKEEVSFLQLGRPISALVRYPVDNRDFSSPERPDRVPDPPLLLYNGYRVISPHVKRLSSEANHSF